MSEITLKKHFAGGLLPIMMIGMIIGFMVLYLMQTQTVFDAERQNIEESINLQKSIMMLQRLRSLEKVIVTTQDKMAGKELEVTANELRQIVKTNLDVVSQYYKLHNEAARYQDFIELQNRVHGLLSTSLRQADIDARQQQYKAAMLQLQRFDVHQSGVKTRVNRKIDETELLLSANAQTITEILAQVERLHGALLIRQAAASQGEVSQIQIYKAAGVLETIHARFRQEFAALQHKLGAQTNGWPQAQALESGLTSLENFVNALDIKHRNIAVYEQYLKLAQDVDESALPLYEHIVETHLAMDNKRMEEVSSNKRELKIFGLLILFGVLVLSVIYVQRNSASLKKLKSMNNSLVRSESNIRNMIELLPHMVVLQNAEGDVLEANRAFKDFYAAILPTHNHQLINLKNSGGLISKLFYTDVEKYKSGQVLTTRKESYSSSDGEKKVMHVYSVPLHVNENHGCILTVMMDMTEVYKIRELQKITGVGCWEWDLGLNKFNFSDKFYETIGIRLAVEPDNFNLYLASVVPEDRQRVEMAFTRAYETHQSIDMEHRVRQKGAEESVVHIKGKIYQRCPDDALHMVGTVQDITSQKRAEEALKLSEMKYRKLVENLSDEYFFYSYDLNGDFSYISPSVSTMLGFTHEELPESEISNLIIKSGPLYSGMSFKQRELNDQGMRRDIAVMNKDNNIRFLELSEVPVFSFAHEVTGFAGIAHDVTDNKLKEADLRESEMRLRQLAVHLQDVRENERASIARDIHDEIGGYLMALKMDISLLNKKLDKTDNRIHSRFQSMSQLIDVAIEATRRMITNLRPSILDELGLIEALEWQLNAFGKRYETQVIFNYDYKTENIDFVDPEHSVNIFRIFQEILNNIAKHAQAKTVSVFIVVHENTFSLSVSDDGIGIQTDEFNKKGSYGILGIQERIKRMEGLLHIYGHQGNGSTVMIRIPLSEDGQYCEDDEVDKKFGEMRVGATRYE
jgi:PAS domain S-box-containing protein